MYQIWDNTEQEEVGRFERIITAINFAAILKSRWIQVREGDSAAGILHNAAGIVFDSTLARLEGEDIVVPRLAALFGHSGVGVWKLRETSVETLKAIMWLAAAAQGDER